MNIALQAVDNYSKYCITLAEAGGHGVKNVFNVGPRLMLFDGMDGITPYTNDGQELLVYINADDGRLMRYTSDVTVIKLSEPDRNRTQNNSKVCSRLRVIIFATF